MLSVRVTILLSFVCLLSASSWTVPATGQTTLQEIRQARLAAALRTYDAISDMRILAARDRISRIESMHSWSQRILSIELEAAPENPRQAIAAYDRHWQRMTDVERRIAARSELGNTSTGEIEASRFFRLDAEHARAAVRAQLAEATDGISVGDDTTTDQPEQLVISIDRVSNYYLGKNQLTKEELALQLAAFEPGPDPKPVIVRVDKQAAIIRRAEILELLKTLNLKYVIQDEQ